MECYRTTDTKTTIIFSIIGIVATVLLFAAGHTLATRQWSLARLLQWLVHSIDNKWTMYVILDDFTTSCNRIRYQNELMEPGT